MSKLTLGFIPGGTGNGLVKSVLDHDNEQFGVLEAAFVIAKGRQMRMDLTEVECEYQTEKVYSFLSVAWAVIADCDINSEVLRFLGQPRFTIWGVYRVFFMRRYLGSILYSGYKVKNENEYKSD